jgi:hypothetical protein
MVAQEQSSCVALVLSAITQSSTQCATNGIDSVCYGHDKVHGSFLEEGPPNVFTKVAEADQNFFLESGDQAQLRLTEAIQTSPFDQTGTPPGWGISVMNVQAGLPGEIIESSDGRGVIYYLLGGVEVEGGVEPDEALALLPAGIEMTTLSAVDMRSAPVTSTSTNIMARIPANTVVNADAITLDGGWVRVVFDDRPGWISRATLGQDVDVSDLVEIGPEDFTPMQAFFFRNGIHHDVTSPECDLAPSFLFVQGPRDVPVHLRVHRVDMRLESSMVLRSLVPGDELGDFFEVVALFGMVTVFPDTEDEILVPPGYVLRLQLGEFVSLGIEGDVDEKVFLRVAGPIRPLTQAELEGLRIVESLPGNILHYVPEVPGLVRPSGAGGVIPEIVFNDPAALEVARRACDEGRLIPEVCQSLGF